MRFFCDLLKGFPCFFVQVLSRFKSGHSGKEAFPVFLCSFCRKKPIKIPYGFPVIPLPAANQCSARSL